MNRVITMRGFRGGMSAEVWCDGFCPLFSSIDFLCKIYLITDGRGHKENNVMTFIIFPAH